MSYGLCGTASITRTREEAIRDEVRDRIVDDVPAKTYHDVERVLPFRHDTSRSTIASILLRFTTGEPRTYAVYVLECLQNSAEPTTALLQGVSASSVSRYADAGASRRVIYIGMAKRVLDRLDQHLNKPGREGANFTALYPPIRVLQVGWFNGQDQAQTAERLTAELLEEKYPKDFVAYPG